MTLRVFSINTSNFGSTGRIMVSLADYVSDSGGYSLVAYAKSRSNMKQHKKDDVYIGSRVSRNFHLLMSYLFGLNGLFSIAATKKLIKEMKHFSPSVIHIHNLHNCYINLPVLFKYLSSFSGKIIWTFHDCWPFTGHCPHYTEVNCYKWETQCKRCPLYRNYPESIVDSSRMLYSIKKHYFTKLKQCIIVTPSMWLASQVNRSFMNKFSVTVVNNGVNLSVFCPKDKSIFRKRYGITEEHIILGVSSIWTRQKGVEIFRELSDILDESYKVVLIGNTEQVNNLLGSRLMIIGSIEGTQALAEAYSSATYFLNPSFQETMGLVTIEALACGTPTIVSNLTAVPEFINSKCGCIVNNNTTEEYYRIIKEKPSFNPLDCVSHAKKYDIEKMKNRYLELYMNNDV